MRIVVTSDEVQQTRFNVHDMYYKLTDNFDIPEEIRHSKEFQCILTWLPSIECISVERNLRYDCIKVYFTNGESITMYDTGMEQLFDIWVDEKLESFRRKANEDLG